MNNKFRNKNSEILKNRLEQYTFKNSLKENIELFKNTILKDDDTIIYRKIKNKHSYLNFCLVFVDGMVNNKIINENIICKLINCKLNSKSSELINYLNEQIIVIDDTKETTSVDTTVNSLLYGDSVLFIDGFDKVLILNTKGWQTRSISEPTSETIINGPREGFNESLNTNISLIRRKINSPNLKFKIKEIGVRTRTKVCITYIDDIVNKKILKELENRLNEIDVEGVFSTELIKEYITDRPLSCFKTIGNTERPDIVASKLLQGRIAILCDGSPTAITLPFLFVEYFQVNEDYYQNFVYASISRFIRLIAFILTIYTPGIYIATIAFHKEMLPSKLALSIYLAREDVPFPIAVEALIMIIIFEILIEAGIRLPKHIGATVSIVGALILGQAAVAAKFIGAAMVIITAITGICELILYNMRGAIIIIRFLFLILGSCLGLYGIILGNIGITIYLISIKTFGIPYMLKITNLDKYNITDIGIRAPWWLLKYRTKFIAKDSIRNKNNTKRRNLQ
ncbi:spore germination protein [Clostridium tepidum]|nr:spore germination protein [Clostridium tepidum]MCR1934034.1 spore germination protein [Clostridium tepidum]MDU6877828.1 spore germination protein [Clostridium botulinum]